MFTYVKKYTFLIVTHLPVREQIGL